MADSIIQKKAYEFAKLIVRLARHLRENGEHVLSRQVLRSGTSIGANVEEAHAAQTRKEFHSKMTISFKEANETRYWLRLLRDTESGKIDCSSLLRDVDELIKILAVITKKTRAVEGKKVQDKG